MSTKTDCLDQTWESPSVLNVLYKSFHVGRNMSRFQSFPLISFRPNLAVSPLTNGLTPHEVQRHRQRGGKGGNYLFIAPVALARWLSLSFLPRPARERRDSSMRALNPLENTLFVRNGPQSAQQQAICSVGLLPASILIWTTDWGHEENIVWSFATVELIQRFLWTWDHIGSRQKEALVGRLAVSESTYVCFPSPHCHHWNKFTPAFQQSVQHRLGLNIW